MTRIRPFIRVGWNVQRYRTRPRWWNRTFWTSPCASGRGLIRRDRIAPFAFVSATVCSILPTLTNRTTWPTWTVTRRGLKKYSPILIVTGARAAAPRVEAAAPPPAARKSVTPPRAASAIRAAAVLISLPDREGDRRLLAGRRVVVVGEE